MIHFCQQEQHRDILCTQYEWFFTQLLSFLPTLWLGMSHHRPIKQGQGCKYD